MEHMELKSEINERIHNRLMLVPELTKAGIIGVRLNDLGTQVYRALTFIDLFNEDELGEISCVDAKGEAVEHNTEESEDVFDTDESKETLMESLREIFGLNCDSGTESEDILNSLKSEELAFEDNKSIDLLEFLKFVTEPSKNIAQAIERLCDTAKILRDPDILDIKVLNEWTTPTTYVIVNNNEKLWDKLMNTIGYKGSANDFIDKLSAMGLLVKNKNARKCFIDITEAMNRGIIQE